MIKNSGKVLAIIIYTGKESKIMMNQGKYKLKKSGIEKQINILIAFNILLLLVLDGIMTGINYRWSVKRIYHMVYNWIPSSVMKTGMYVTAFKAAKKLVASYYLLFN